MSSELFRQCSDPFLWPTALMSVTMTLQNNYGGHRQVPTVFPGSFTLQQHREVKTAFTQKARLLSQSCQEGLWARGYSDESVSYFLTNSYPPFVLYLKLMY